jgi:hypothetical protein
LTPAPSSSQKQVLHGLRLGAATATIFWRDARSHAEIVEKKGALRPIHQPPTEALSAGLLDRFCALLYTLIH